MNLKVSITKKYVGRPYCLDWNRTSIDENKIGHCQNVGK
jgi:hypothetical protein